jgi:hypothetical protein
MMRDLNVMLNKKVFNLKKQMIGLLCVFVPYTIIGYYGLLKSISDKSTNSPKFTTMFFINFCLAIIWFVVIIRNLRQISGSIAMIEMDNKLEKPITKGKTTLFFFLYFTAIPYIQYHMNKIVDIYNQNKSI